MTKKQYCTGLEVLLNGFLNKPSVRAAKMSSIKNLAMNSMGRLRYILSDITDSVVDKVCFPLHKFNRGAVASQESSLKRHYDVR